MTTENTTTTDNSANLDTMTFSHDLIPSAKIDDVEDSIDFAIAAVSDAGISIVVEDVASFLAGINDKDQAAAELYELGRLIEYHGVLTSKPEVRK